MSSKRFVVVSSFIASVALAGAAATWVRVAESRSLGGAPASASATTARPKPPTIRAEGRVVAGRGGQVTIGAEVAGAVAAVLVDEGATVRAGEVLATLREPEQAAALREAYAHAREATVAAQALDEDATRTRTLVESGAMPKVTLSHIVHDRDAARARRAAANAAAARLAAASTHARIVAPIAGTVVMRKVEPGEMVAPGAPLFVIVDLTRLRVEAEVDEFDASRVQSSMKAEVSAEGAGGAPLHGHVDEIGLMIAPRGIRPQDPARPLDAQVLKVKVGLDGDAASSPLRLGQRVSVTFQGTSDGA